MERVNIARFWDFLKQKTLFPMAEELGPLTDTLEQLIRVWEVLRIEEKVHYELASTGRRPRDRGAIARAFVAKSCLKIPTTTALIDRLRVDSMLRRLCGFEQRKDIPSEPTFSRAFAEFSETQLGQRVHEDLVKHVYETEIVGHISRDSTAIEAREKPLKKVPVKKERTCKKGRPKTGEERHPKERTRLEKQSQPKICTVLDRLQTSH